MEKKTSLSSLAEARGLSIRTSGDAGIEKLSKAAGLSSLLQRSGPDQQLSSIVAAARKRNAKVSLKCESLEVDTAHIRGLRSASHLVKTKSFTYGLTSGGSDSDMSQGSQSGIQVSFPAMNSMRATLNVPFVNSPFVLRDTFDSRGSGFGTKTTADIGNHQLSKLFKACTTQYLDALHAFLHIEKQQEYTFNDTIDSSVSRSNSVQSGTLGLVLPPPTLSAVPSIVLSADDVQQVSIPSLMNEAMGRYIDVLISFSEVLQREDRLPEATMLLLAGLVHVNHAVHPLQAKTAMPSRQGSLSGTHQMITNNKSRPLSATLFATGIAIPTANGVIFDDALLMELDSLLNRLLTPITGDATLSSGSTSSRSSGQAVINSGIEMLPGTDVPLFVSTAGGRTVHRYCSLLTACYVYRDADSVENLHAITLLVKRFGVLLRAQGALAEAMVSLQAATHVFKVLSEACEEYLADLAGSYALLAATLAEIGIEEESTRMDDEARMMDMKALELASILATT